MNTLKHVIVDGGAGFLMGGVIDSVFDKIHTTEKEKLVVTTVNGVAMLALKVAAQSFVSIALAVEVNGFLYPETIGDDPTNGFWMLWTMLEGSPHFRQDCANLHVITRAWLETAIFSKIIKKVEEKPMPETEKPKRKL
jgi:hypothetical protein